MLTDEWTLLRTKTDETTPDADYVGTNETPADLDVMPLGPSREVRYSGIEVIVLGVDASRVPVDRSTNTCDVTLIHVIARPGADDPLLSDPASVADVPLQRPTYFPTAGGEFGIRISNNAAIAGVAALEVWWRPVSR
jgi:hypothetical protein